MPTEDQQKRITSEQMLDVLESVSKLKNMLSNTEYKARMQQAVDLIESIARDLCWHEKKAQRGSPYI